ncbi:hypothetical protein O3P69_020024 [Scylla paramamosain]|uniref:CCHC-type domain-containing protein n=1 Tax=Scylla paramamosain TaxID=85552 RepID=A0AAW0TL76_SCYPA
MPLPRRSPRSTPRASTTVVPRSLQPLLQQARQTISDQQQAITTLQANMAALITRGNVAPAPRVPREMRPGYDTSCIQWPRQEAVHHVRLLCGPPLQRALDARFTFDQWSALTQQEALDAIGNLVLRSSSPAVQWAEFFGVSQGQDECASDYFVRGAQKVNDCAFECPQYSLNLSEYLLLKKLVVGIRDTGLKQQPANTPQAWAGWRESSRAAGTVRAEEDGDQTLDAAAATTSGKTQPSRTCWNCGTSHAPDRASCPAREAVCVACRKKGHFKRCCRSSKRPHGTASANAVSGSVTTAGANVSRQPTIEVTVALGKGAKHRTAAVADTGAQVCVAGAALLSSLNIQPTQLQGRAGLRDVADLPLRCLGSCRYPALRSPTTDTDANLDEDLTEAVAAVVIATAEHEGHVLDESALRPLSPGTRVRMQNQASGTWDRTGLIVEALPYRQYTVRLDGSGQISLRNRKHLRPVAESTPPPAPPTLRPPTPPAAQPTTTPAQVSTPTQPQLRPAPRRQVR